MQFLTILRWLSFPISLVYSFIISVRNFLFDKNILKYDTITTPSIVVGNLAIGGTGKTPLTEYLIELLQKEGKTVALISRGYGRKTKGLIIASENSSAETIGDEPKQIQEKFDKLLIIVAEQRKTAIDFIEENYPKVDVIILDDAFQHRKIKSGFNILTSTYLQPYFSDLPIPTGNLRDNKKETKRAQFLIYTKCPEKIEHKKWIRKSRHFQEKNIAFSAIEYNNCIGVFNQNEKQSPQKGDEILLVTGIAKPTPLVNYLDKSGAKVTHLNYPDHHNFSSKDIEKMLYLFDKFTALNKYVLTTEKDAVRLKSHPMKNQLQPLPIFAIGIGIDWKIGEEKLRQRVLNYVNENGKR